MAKSRSAGPRQIFLAVKLACFEVGAGSLAFLDRANLVRVIAGNPRDAAFTLMIFCGSGMAGWGYLDPNDATFTKTTPPPRFLELQRALNPHQFR